MSGPDKSYEYGRWVWRDRADPACGDTNPRPRVLLPSEARYEEWQDRSMDELEDGERAKEIYCNMIERNQVMGEKCGCGQWAGGYGQAGAQGRYEPPSKPLPILSVEDAKKVLKAAKLRQAEDRKRKEAHDKQVREYAERQRQHQEDREAARAALLAIIQNPQEPAEARVQAAVQIRNWQ